VEEKELPMSGVSRKEIEGEQEAWGSGREAVGNEGIVSRKKDIEGEQEAWGSGREGVAIDRSEQERNKG